VVAGRSGVRGGALGLHLLWDVLNLWLPPLVYIGAVVLLYAAGIVAFILVRRASAAFERRADAAASTAAVAPRR
jgi:hypothetical protein